MILAIHHVQITIPKGAEPQAREFYCGLLGLTEIAKPDEFVGRGGFWLEVGDRQVHVGTEDRVDGTMSKAPVAYLVDNIDPWRSKLVENNIEVVDGIQIPGYERFEFRDPFGNRIEFMHRLKN
jgi:catechol 2,3-dioxygenase-like lactoylglutathione lyase family enzyme